jgi:hypothetical protein
MAWHSPRSTRLTVDIRTPTFPSASIPTTNQPDQPQIHTETMSLASLPNELQNQILFQIVLSNSDLDDNDIAVPQAPELTFNMLPYLLASSLAFQCWQANGHVILHRVATIKLAATATYRRRLRRAYVLARLRVLVWLAALKEAENQSLLSVPARAHKLLVASCVGSNARVVWRRAERHANYWRRFLRSQ